MDKTTIIIKNTNIGTTSDITKNGIVTIRSSSYGDTLFNHTVDIAASGFSISKCYVTDDK